MSSLKSITDGLNIIVNTSKSMQAFFYQKTIQTVFTNNQLATYPIDYNLLIPGSESVNDLTDAQISVQMQAYINMCDALVLVINSNIEWQTNLAYSTIQNQLNQSIAQLNGFGIALLNAQYQGFFRYKVPYDMGFSEVLYNNGISLDDYVQQARLNYNVADFNNILRNQIIVLNKG